MFKVHLRSLIYSSASDSVKYVCNLAVLWEPHLYKVQLSVVFATWWGYIFQVFQSFIQFKKWDAWRNSYCFSLPEKKSQNRDI